MGRKGCLLFVHYSYDFHLPSKQGATNRCRLSWLTNSALVYEPKCGGRGVVAGSQSLSKAVNNAHGAQINFGDLTPYLTYASQRLTLEDEITPCRVGFESQRHAEFWRHLTFLLSLYIYCCAELTLFFFPVHMMSRGEDEDISSGVGI
jgi:hypothetical protein